ncbi:cytochrome P450 2B12 [Trichonephila clavata]|uniref:Cytochrome P450 2B12 n=1 Tax=Trichonephila clavata TaxID=2740835 RepID=A0A8X6FUB6_TRICU|nr:cytochrome P450 2B12 [Trichonephila clavata]
MEDIIFEIVEEHKSTYNEENVRDIIDDYFKERDERRRKEDPTAKFFTDETLIGTLIQMIGDGIFSVASFISLWMKKLAEHPEEQDKLYQEILDVIGLDRQPTMEDKSKLTYFNAFISEVMRTSDFFNLFPSLECINFFNLFPSLEWHQTIMFGRVLYNDASVSIPDYSSSEFPTRITKRNKNNCYEQYIRKFTHLCTSQT